VGHGGESIEELQIPMFIYGPGVAKGMEITGFVNNYDIASTIAYVLGLKQPDAWIAKPLKFVFDGSGKSLVKRERIIKTPQIFPDGGLFNEKTTDITLTSNTTGECKIYYTTDGTVPDEKSALYMTPFKLSKQGKLKAVAISNANECSRTGSADFRIINNDLKENGINFTYYEGDFNLLPDFKALTPISSGVVKEISLDSIKHRGDHFAVKFDGMIKIDAEGEYKFFCSSDDGSRLIIDGKETVANDYTHRLYTRSAKTKLTKGMHKISVEYFDAGDAFNLFVKYSGPGIEKRTVSPDMLFTK
jgi:hypothetical protein